MNLMSIPRNCTLAAALLAATISTSVNAGEKLRLNFGVYSANKPSAMVKVFRPVLKQLENSMSEKLQLEVDIRMQIAKDYDQGISDLVNGRVDFSHFGPASYVEAKRMNNDINIIAVEKLKNSKVSYGIIAVHKDSPISDIRDLRGKAFAFGDEGSTIGRFLSQLELVQADILGVDLSRYEYLGRHDKVGTAVGAGAFDAGALNEKTFKKLVEAGEPIRELVRFPNVSKPWIARSGFDENVLIALRESLLSITDPKVYKAMKIDGFLEGSDIDYAVIRRAMENNDAFFDIRDEQTDYTSATDYPKPAEPVMQAAVTKPAPVAEISSTSPAQPLPAAELAMPQARGSRSITVNIELPAEFYSKGHYTGPDALTINLKIPQPTQ
ncbi:MAG: PhnD/SsuA/transferrin family substrate-binding protein [Granulosicoccus sp.]